MKTILFYTSTPRAFHSYLKYVLASFNSKKNKIVLLAEDIFEEDKKDLKVFDTVSIRQYSGEKRNRYQFNKYCYEMAREVIDLYQPDIVIASSDFNSEFEMYLFRLAKKIGAERIAVQWSIIAESKKISRLVDLMNVYRLLPHRKFPFPVKWRLQLIKIRKHLGHILVYWLLPLSIGQKPFIGKSSYLLRTGVSGMRDSTSQIVMSDKDKSLFIKEGVPKEKIIVKMFLTPTLVKEDYGDKIVTLLVPSEIVGGIRKSDLEFIDRETHEKSWFDTLHIVLRCLPDWKIYIRCHPSTKDLSYFQKMLCADKRVYWSNPNTSAEQVLKKSDLIIGLSPSYSTLLYTSTIQYPKKHIVTLDYFDEIMGDYFKNEEKMAYIKNDNQLVLFLNQL